MLKFQPSTIAFNAGEKQAFPFHIANLQYDFDLAKSLLGDPTHREWVDGLGKASYWAFAYPCGLRLAYEYIEPLGLGMTGIANVLADLPEITHAVRHIPFPDSVQSPSTLEANVREFEALSKMGLCAASLKLTLIKCGVRVMMATRFLLVIRLRNETQNVGLPNWSRTVTNKFIGTIAHDSIYSKLKLRRVICPEIY